MFKWKEDNPIYQATNVIEIAKDRDFGHQDVFIPLWYEPETKRLKNCETEAVHYGWEKPKDQGTYYKTDKTFEEVTDGKI